MAFNQIKNKNHVSKVTTLDNRSPVYAGNWNELVTAKNTISVDTISEKTSGSGVTIDSVLLKDGAVSADTINESTSAAGVTIDGVVLKDSTILYKEATEVVSATNVITAAETGTTFFLNDATEFASTLPAPAAGLKFKFIVTAAPSGADYTVLTDSSDNIIQGTVVVNGASVAGANEDTITFADGAAVVGDWVEVVSDGTNWYVSGVGQAAASITLTQAS